MNIDWVIPCRYIEVHDNLGTLVGAGIDTWWVQQLPSPIQVVMAVRLTATAEELGPDQKHQARNLVTDPGGNTIGDESGEFAVGLENARTDWLNGVMLQTLAQFQADEAGTYHIEHQVDQSSKSVPIHVVHGLPSGVEPPT